MNISPAFNSVTTARIAAPAAAPQETFDARAKGDDMALLDNFVRTSGSFLPDSGQLKDFALGALPVVGMLKNGGEALTGSIFGSRRTVREKGAGALLNAGGTAALISGIASGSGLAILGSAVLLAGSGILSAQ